VAVSDVPAVTPSGNVIVAGGYHAESGIYFTCSEEEARAILPEDLSEDAVRDAYQFLADELFVDVALHDRHKGMAALVACLLTSTSHSVLPEKPVFCVKAPQRGSGKTTLVNMIVRPVTRRSAVAASWSVNEEERRKAFFAVAREGHGILMIDNIPRGTVIRDATIERFATSAEVRDRVLGESRTEAVRSPVVVLTGNALQMGGDSGSRTLTIELNRRPPRPREPRVQAPGHSRLVRSQPGSDPQGRAHHTARQSDAEERDGENRDPLQGVVRAGWFGGRARGKPRWHAGAHGRPVCPERGRGRYRQRAG
jgi:hypothetical protein